MKVCGNDIKVQGRLIRTGSLAAEPYEFLEDPEAALEDLQKAGVRMDLFTFIQKLSQTSRQYAYPTEPDNLAVLPVSTFDAWWTSQLGREVVLGEWVKLLMFLVRP